MRPLPDWSEFDDADLADLDDTARAAFRERSIPSPARVTREPQDLSDERRYDVPATVICTEFTAAMLQDWIDEGLAPVREFTKIKDVEYLDLPTGHWPQFTGPRISRGPSSKPLLQTRGGMRASRLRCGFCRF